MKRKYRSKKIRIVGAVVFLALMIFSSVFVIWQMKTNEFGGLIDRIEEVFYGTPFKNAYNAKSLILVDLSNDEVFISKRENEQQLPASLAKLFVIKYAVSSDIALTGSSLILGNSLPFALNTLTTVEGLL